MSKLKFSQFLLNMKHSFHSTIIEKYLVLLQDDDERLRENSWIATSVVNMVYLRWMPELDVLNIFCTLRTNFRFRNSKFMRLNSNEGDEKNILDKLKTIMHLHADILQP